MSVRESYELLGGNYDAVMMRLTDEERVKRYTRVFLKNQCFYDLIIAFTCEDYEMAFHHSMFLKEASSNLEFTELFEVSKDMSESLRPGVGDYDKAVNLIPTLTRAYERTVMYLKGMLAER